MALSVHNGRQRKLVEGYAAASIMENISQHAFFVARAAAGGEGQSTPINWSSPSRHAARASFSQEFDRVGLGRQLSVAVAAQSFVGRFFERLARPGDARAHKVALFVGRDDVLL
jgi:hypothetical protein